MCDWGIEGSREYSAVFRAKKGKKHNGSETGDCVVIQKNKLNSAALKVRNHHGVAKGKLPRSPPLGPASTKYEGKRSEVDRNACY